MAKSLEEMFEKIPFEEAYTKMKEYYTTLKQLEKEGAKLRGESEIDKRYTELWEESAKYRNQFTAAEILALTDKLFIEIKQLKKNKVR